MLTALGDVANRNARARTSVPTTTSSKPFSPKELEARIRCGLLRRVRQKSKWWDPQLRGDPGSDLRNDNQQTQCTGNDERIRSPGMNSACWKLLVSRWASPFSRGEILKEVWGYTRSVMWTPWWWMSHLQACAPNWKTIRQPERSSQPGARVYCSRRNRESLVAKEPEFDPAVTGVRSRAGIRRLVIWYRATLPVNQPGGHATPRRHDGLGRRLGGGVCGGLVGLNGRLGASTPCAAAAGCWRP